jgi:hypothetical protein
MKEAINKAFEESVQAKLAFLRDHEDKLITAIDALVAAFNRGNKLLLFGNGGSAADAQHIAAEFVNRFRISGHPAGRPHRRQLGAPASPTTTVSRLRQTGDGRQGCDALAIRPAATPPT